MPYTNTEPELPYSGNTETSQQCSHEAAVSQVPARAWKTEKYKRYLQCVGRASDHQAADDLAWPLSSICSIRNGLMDRGFIEVAGTIEGKYGKKVTLWQLAASAEAMSR